MAGRPRKNIDKEQFEKLCFLHCTLEEIAGYFDCSQDTIRNFCKREYKEPFFEVYKKKSAGGNISLRRWQYQLAEKGNATMLIWLGRQVLGQTENPTEHIEAEDSDAYLSEAGIQV